MKMMKKGIILLIGITLLCGGCSKAKTEKVLDLDLEDARVLENYNTRSGGEDTGLKYDCYDCTLDPLLDTIENDEHWSPLPFSNEVQVAYELAVSCIDTTFAREIPDPVLNGYYYFYDRSEESEDPYDVTDINNRDYYNFTLAIYDTSNDYLYYIELDYDNTVQE